MNKNSEPLITIIVPTYNRELTIKRTVESVLKQTYNNWELIIVDDGSTDGTRQVMQSYLGDKRIVYAPTENSGASHARNVGLEMARGEYISFLDSDDEYEPGRLEKQLNKMQLLESKFSMCCRIVDKGGVITLDEPIERLLTKSDIIKGGIALSTSLFMFHKSIKEKQRFEEGLASLQDFDFLLRALETESVQLLGEHLTIIHKAPDIDRISNDFRIVASGRRQILQRVINGVYQITREEASLLRASLAFSAGFYWFLCGDEQAARPLFKQFQSEPQVPIVKKIISYLIYTLTFIPYASFVADKMVLILWKSNSGFLKKFILKFGR